MYLYNDYTFVQLNSINIVFNCHYTSDIKDG